MKEKEGGGAIKPEFSPTKKEFDPPKNKKPSVQKVPLYGIYGDI